MELNFHFETKESGYRNSTYYKNQIAENSLHSWFRGLSILGFSVNIHQEKASEVLTLNRNKIKPEFHQKLFNQLLDSAFKIIVENFDNIFKTEEERAIGSMFLHFYSDNEIVKNMTFLLLDIGNIYRYRLGKQVLK